MNERQFQAGSKSTEVDATASKGRLVVRGVIRVVVAVALCVVGARAGWTQLWWFLGVMLATMVINLTVIRRYNPGLIWARLKKDQPTQRFDVFVLLSGLVWSTLIFVVAGLDVLVYRWTVLPWWGTGLGVAMWLVGLVPITWSMATNPYLERVVRHQEEKGHRPITTGPYRWVRHPMYVGFLLMLASWPLILGSLWAFVPMLAMGITMIYRTHREDRLLRVELPGYEEYAQRTKYRLVPLVW